MSNSNKPTVATLLESQKKQIALALPKHMTADRMSRIALTEIRKNPELGLCDPLSFLGAIIQCSQLGLEPGGGMGHVYLVPFNNRKKGIKEVQIIPGYRGLIDLARRSAQIISISARTVHENDEFEYSYGLEETLVHKPSMSDRGELIGAYAVAKLKDGGQQFEFMSREQIDKISTGSGIWRDHYDEMARKTVVRRLVKYLPMSIEMASLIEISDREETKVSQENESLLLDVGVKPIETKTNLLEDEAQELRDDVKQRLLEKINETREELSKHGLDDGKVLDFLQMSSFDDLKTMSAESLQAVMEAVHSLKPS